MDDKQNIYNIFEDKLKNIKIKTYKKGDIAEGVIEKIQTGFIVVKIDDIYDAVVPNSELVINPKKPFAIGDKIKVFVSKAEDEIGSMQVSQKRTTTSQRWDLLEEAYKNEEVLTVVVSESNNGGVIVNIDGVSGFVPTSQLDPNKAYKIEGAKDESHEGGRKLNDLIGSKLNVKIMEIDREKNKVIFSERLALDNQSNEQRMNILKNVEIGSEFNAVITATTNYGIFVNADGIDGLVHVSEISWDKVENPSTYAHVGDKLRVKLISVEDEGKKVAFSIKQLSDDPWMEVSKDYKVGSIVKGTVTEVEDYGLIIKIDEGVTGLVHKSELTSEQIGDPRDLFKVGQEVKALVLTIAPSERKMGLSIKRLSEKRSDKKAISVKPKMKKKEKGSLDIEGALEKAKNKLEK